MKKDAKARRQGMGNCAGANTKGTTLQEAAADEVEVPSQESEPEEIVPEEAAESTEDAAPVQDDGKLDEEVPETVASPESLTEEAPEKKEDENLQKEEGEATQPEENKVEEEVPLEPKKAAEEELVKVEVKKEKELPPWLQKKARKGKSAGA